MVEGGESGTSTAPEEGNKKMWNNEEAIDAFLRGRCCLPRTSPPDATEDKMGEFVTLKRKAEKKELEPLAKMAKATATPSYDEPKKNQERKNKALYHDWGACYKLYTEHVRLKGPGATINKEITQEGSQLAKWATLQRKAHENNELEDDRKALLDQLGFNFKSCAKFHPHFDWLSEYVHKHNKLPPAGTPEGKRSLTWLNLQRRKLNKNNGKIDNVSEEKVHRVKVMIELLSYNLQGIGWEANFEKLKAFSQTNGGNVNFLKNCCNSDIKVYDWAKRQRNYYKKGNLSDDRVNRLLSIGFDFDWTQRKAYYDAEWEKMYDNLVDYQRDHGTLNVPWDYKSERHGSLGNWVSAIKSTAGGYHGKMTLTDYRVKKLTKLGFDFRLSKLHYEDTWAKRLKEYSDYKSANNGKEPPNNTSIGGWRSTQRDYFRRGILAQNRLERLREAGFDLTPSEETLECDWRNSLKAFIEYKEAKETEPPSGTSLGSWCDRQRWLYRKGNLAKKRAKMLSLANFDFLVQRSKHHQMLEFEEWKKMFPKVLRFYKENGHSDVGENDPSLAVWVNRYTGNLPRHIGKHFERLGYGETATLEDLLKTNAANMTEMPHPILDSESESEGDDAPTPSPAPAFKLSEELQTKILEAFKNDKSPSLPNAASEVDFDVMNPPESVREPTKKAGPIEQADVKEHDVLLPRRGNFKQPIFSCKGTSSFRALIDDFQLMYLMVPRHRRHSIAKSLVFIVQKRGGRFFQQDSNNNSLFHECDDEAIIKYAARAIGQNKRGVGIRLELQRLASIHNPSNSTAEEKKSLPVPTGINHKPYMIAERDESQNDPVIFDTIDHGDGDDISVDDAQHLNGKNNSAAAELTQSHQESAYWDSQCHALHAYIQQHGQPPQTREENPSLYDWCQLLKARKLQIESMML